MKRKALVVAPLICLAVAGSANAAPRPFIVPVECKPSYAIAPRQDITPLTVTGGVSFFCSIRLRDAVEHPEFNISYRIHRIQFYRRKNDETPFSPKGAAYTQQTWKPLKRVVPIFGNIWTGEKLIDRRARITTRAWEWQTYVDVSFRASMVDPATRTVQTDIRRTGLFVSQISELRYR